MLSIVTWKSISKGIINQFLLGNEFPSYGLPVKSYSVKHQLTTIRDAPNLHKYLRVWHLKKLQKT